MKKLLIKTVIICLVSPGWACVYGKEMPHFREKVDIPPEIAEANTVSEVQPYLESPTGVTRIAAARRLGQLGDPNAVSLLVARFAKEPYEAAIDTSPYVKLEIIEALGKIGGEQAKNSLLNIFDTYWKQGPIAQRYVWEDSDYMKVVPATLEALYEWRDEIKIINLFESVYLKETRISAPDIREKAYELYSKADMEKRNIVSPENIIRYLSSMITGIGEGREEDWVKGKTGEKTLEAIKNGAMVKILIKCGEPALPFIDTELNKVPLAGERRRYEALYYAKEQINKAVERNRKEKITEANDVNAAP